MNRRRRNDLRFLSRLLLFGFGSGLLWDLLSDHRLRGRLDRSSGSRTRLSGLSCPLRLPRRVERHLAHLAHALLGGTGDHEGLVDPGLELADQRHGAAGDDPILGAVALFSLDKAAI